MARKSATEGPKSRSGPRAPTGKKPLTVIVDEGVIMAAKIAAIEDGLKVSGIVEKLLREWMTGRKSRR